MFPIDISPSAFPSVPFSEWDWSFIIIPAAIIFLFAALSIWFYRELSFAAPEQRQSNIRSALSVFIVLSLTVLFIATERERLSARQEAQSGYIEQALEDQYGLDITGHTADSIVAYINHDRTVGAFSVPITVTDSQGQSQKIDAVIDHETQTLGLFNGPTELPRASWTDKLISSLPDCKADWDIRLDTRSDRASVRYTTATIITPDTAATSTDDACLETTVTIQSDKEKIEWDTENLPENVRIETTRDPITPTAHTLHMIVDGEIEPGTEFTIAQK